MNLQVEKLDVDLHTDTIAVRNRAHVATDEVEFADTVSLRECENFRVVPFIGMKVFEVASNADKFSTEDAHDPFEV